MIRILAGIVFGLILVDALWARYVGFSISDVLSKGLQIGAIGSAGGLYLSIRPNARLAEMLAYVQLWLVFSAAAAVMTYLAAALNYPFQDSAYRHADVLLHFDLHATTKMLQSFPLIWRLLSADYSSLLFQISMTVLWLAHTRSHGRNAQLLGSAILSFLVSCIVSAILPAMGPSITENPSLSGPPTYLADTIAMRSGLPVSKTLETLQGIICFPSFHTVLAVLLTWSHRRLVSFWPVVVINATMLMSVPSVGNHYLIDVLGGLAVASASMIFVRACARFGPISAAHRP